jgi:protein-S-isoprenylcysteine O-methyltransferase Ste14
MKVPPPVYALAAVALMWLLDKKYPVLETTQQWPMIVGGVLILVGILIDVLSIVQFRQARTTVNPLRPETSSTLVTSGFYAHSRNPMYVGLLFSLVGVTLLLRSLTPLLVLPLFVLIVTMLQILPEEKALATIFGEEFQYYKQRVPRWLW